MKASAKKRFDDCVSSNFGTSTTDIGEPVRCRLLAWDDVSVATDDCPKGNIFESMIPDMIEKNVS